jgi:hypothetical protein
LCALSTGREHRFSTCHSEISRHIPVSWSGNEVVCIVAEVTYSGCLRTWDVLTVKSRNIRSERVSHTNYELVATGDIDKREALSLSSRQPAQQ